MSAVLLCPDHGEAWPCVRCQLARAEVLAEQLRLKVVEHELRARAALASLDTFERYAVEARLCERAQLTNTETWVLTAPLRLARSELGAVRPTTMAAGRLHAVKTDEQTESTTNPPHLAAKGNQS